MTQKTIYEKKIKTRVLVPEVPAVTEKYEEDVPRVVWDCDYCGKGSGDKMPECFGCGKHACYKCAQEENGVLKEYEFEVGTPEDSWDNGYNPASEDHRFDRFRLCPDCRLYPPEKIEDLMNHIKGLEDLEKVEYDIKNIIIDEIERVKGLPNPKVAKK